MGKDVVHTMHEVIVAKVMCTYCTYSLGQKLLRADHTYSLLQKLSACCTSEWVTSFRFCHLYPRFAPFLCF